jgi:hypothetical protein
MKSLKLLKPPIVIPVTEKYTTWDKWLAKIEFLLIKKGYSRFEQNIKHEDFAYWKKFEGYQVGILFYDFRKFTSQLKIHDRIAVQFECMLIDIDDRIDLSVSKDISLEQFELMAKSFFNAMSQYSSL